MRKAIISGLAVMLLVAFMPLGANADYYHNSDLYNSADELSYDHMFTLYQNTTLNVNTEDGNISFAVKCTPWNDTVVDFDYKVVITLDDGTTNNSYTVLISATNETVWGSVEVDPTEYAYNNSGVITLTLTDSIDNPLDYYKGQAGFYKSSFGGYMADIIGLMIFVAIVGIVGLMAKRMKKK